jgi:large exoprotein involved in heme utilization and adhesion
VQVAPPIDGTLQSSITSADLFILNPNGVMIGAGANINIDGGLYLTSANSLTFADGSQRLVSDTGASGFTAAASSEFGFGMTPADISFDGVSITTPQTSPGVYVDAPFDSLVVAGGDLTFNNSSVLLACKDIELVSLNGAASVLVGGNNATLVGETDLGNIVISNDVEPTMVGNLQTSGDPAGKITVVGNRLSMSKAFVFSDSLGDNVGDGIQIALSDSLVLTDGSRITTDTLAYPDSNSN